MLRVPRSYTHCSLVPRAFVVLLMWSGRPQLLPSTSSFVMPMLTPSFRAAAFALAIGKQPWPDARDRELEAQEGNDRGRRHIGCGARGASASGRRWPALRPYVWHHDCALRSGWPRLREFRGYPERNRRPNDQEDEKNKCRDHHAAYPAADYPEALATLFAAIR